MPPHFHQEGINMLETFGGRFNITERIFDKQDYSQVITESAKLTELAIRHIFYNFRYWLSSEDSRARFLSFEKEMETQKERKGVSFMEFLSKPTIGVGIKYYLLLCDKFPEHTWADKSLVKNFDTVNNLRNPASHAAPINPPQSQDAYEVLHSTKKILDRLNLLDEEMYTLGVPLQHYLVFRSIQEKFEVSDEEEQFKQIIHDACVIIPPLVHLLLDRLYFLLPLEYKIEILKIQSSDDANNKDFKSVMTDYQGFFYNVKPLADLLDTKSLLNDTEGILESISSETISRFKTAPYIGVLKTICTFLTKPDQKS
ncbi:hypothetical protein KKA14_14555, partial [bacterium]|nr:hypothetical protein [bacterium]